MGLGDLFRRRRERESAIPSSSTDPEALGSFAKAEGQPVIGQQVGRSGTQFSGDLADLQGADVAEGLAALAGLGPMIQQAIATGNIQIQQGEAQTIDLRGTGLREQILGIMQEHGVDAQQGAQIDASTMPEVQQQILEALSEYGVDTGAGGSGFNVQADPDATRE